MSSKLNLRLSVAALGLAMAAGSAFAQQEQTAAPAQPVVIAQGSAAMQDLQLFSSSAANTQDDSKTQYTTLDLGKSIGPNADADPQYGGGYGGPPRRRPYGRPTYRDRYSNPDGSTKFAFEAGVGPTTAAGSTGHYNRTGYDFSVGVGRNFSRAFGVLFQYDYAHMGVVPSILNLYSQQAMTPIGGATHLWSLTVNPVIYFSDPHSSYGAYVVFGGGFYRKMTVFTEQATDIYGNSGNVSCGTTCHVSNNAGGLNGGLGFFWKITQDSNAKIFAEARYTWVDNSQTAASQNTVFPQNNYRTGYFPVTLGLRF